MESLAQIILFLLIFSVFLIILRYIDKGAENFKILTKLTIFPIASLLIDIIIIFVTFPDSSKEITDICLIIFVMCSSVHMILSIIKYKKLKGAAIALFQTFVILFTMLAASLLAAVITICIG